MYILTKRKPCWHLPVKHRLVERAHPTALQGTRSALSPFCGRRLGWGRGWECWTEGQTAVPRSCIARKVPGLHLLPLRALGGLRFLCGEGVVVQMSVSRCRTVEFVQSLGKERDRMVTAPVTPTLCAFAFMPQRQVETRCGVRFVLCTNSWLCQVSDREKNKGR